MGGDCIFYDGKSEACASEFARAPFVNAIETLEEVFQMLRLYTRAVVAYKELVVMAPFHFCLLTTNHEARGSRGVGNGVVDEVSEDAVDEALVAQHLYMSW